MSTIYTVKPGDTLSGIARKHNIPNFRTIYDHPDNSEFKRKRPNPNLIFPSDRLVIPDSDRPGPPLKLPKPLPGLPFKVPGSRFLIGQKSQRVCWAAAFAMLKSSRLGRRLTVTEALQPHRDFIKKFDDDVGLEISETAAFGKRYFLKPVPEANVDDIALGPVRPLDVNNLPASIPTPAQFLSLMNEHGMLLVFTSTFEGQVVNPGGHVRVMHGIKGSLTDIKNCQVDLLDPFDPSAPTSGNGREDVRDFEKFIAEYFIFSFVFHRSFGTTTLNQIWHF